MKFKLNTPLEIPPFLFPSRSVILTTVVRSDVSPDMLNVLSFWSPVD